MSRSASVFLAALAGLLVAGPDLGPRSAAADGHGSPDPSPTLVEGFEIRSPAFEPMGEIPGRLTCEGADRSPELRWSGAPEGTKSFVLIVDDPDAPDPDAPRMTWVHWVLYDIPAETSGLPEAVAEDALPKGTRLGQNSWNRTTYGGPCPPVGRHRYFHKLFALREPLGDLGTPTSGDLEKAMEGKVLAQTLVVGTYQKKR